MNIERDQILDAVREGKGRLTKRDLVRTLGLSGDKRRELRYVLKSLLDDGLIIRDDRKQFRVADSLPNVMVLSVDHVDDQGDLIAMPLKWDGHDKPPPIRIVERKKHKKIMAQLGVGDKVLCRINKTQNGYRGDVIKKLARAGRQELGIIVKGGRGLRIRSVKKGSRQDFIPQKGTEVSDQDLVMFELSQTRHKGERIARVCEIIGKADGPHAASIISLYEANIPIGFSEDELAEARALTLPSIDKTREDLRDLPLVTIDPEDAKDFDDAIFARPDDTAKNEGGYIVWVAIADVSAYVLPGSALDKGAYKRGNSVYLPDRVVPMLPEEISADLCSLRPHEDRACLAVRMVFDAHGDKIAHTFKRGLMRS
ncbi:MAG TPA: RNB domain-containing ribonuclease, partial [Hellea balneolensis]|nr:RNB domain-containing ribonuclease [Hellea balneolensis]